MIKYHPVFRNYSCDCSGRIYGKRGQLMLGCVSTTGYRQYEFDGITTSGHTFVWECFNGVIEDRSLVINHKDLNKQNNAITNLELVTQQENVHHYYSTEGVKHIKPVTLSTRKAMHNAKLSEQQVREIILLCLQGVTNKEISLVYHIHERYVSLIRHKKRWKSIWLEMGLETSTTIPSGSRVKRPEVEGTTIK